MSDNSTNEKPVVAPAPAPHPHFQFHLNLGQIVGIALLGLQAYKIQDTAPGGPAVLLDPAEAVPFAQGILSLFPPAPAPPAA